MTTFAFINNVKTLLAGNVSSGATTITLSNAANLPASIASGETLVFTLNDAATRQDFEIVYANGPQTITGGTVTVVRGREGTTALSWLVGDYVYSGPTAGQMGNAGQLGADNTWTGANAFSNPVTVGNGALSGEAVNLGQFPFVATNPGYTKFPNGLIFQWGIVTGSAVLSSVATFPIPFPNVVLNRQATLLDKTAGAENVTLYSTAAKITTSTIQLSLIGWVTGSWSASYQVWGY